MPEVRKEPVSGGLSLKWLGGVVSGGLQCGLACNQVPSWNPAIVVTNDNEFEVTITLTAKVLCDDGSLLTVVFPAAKLRWFSEQRVVRWGADVCSSGLPVTGKQRIALTYTAWRERTVQP